MAATNLQPAAPPARRTGRRIGDLLKDANGRPLIERAGDFTPKGQKVLSLEIPADYDAKRTQAVLEMTAANIDRLSIQSRSRRRLGEAAQEIAGPQSAPDPMLDKPRLARLAVHAAAGMASALPQPVQQGGQWLANKIYEAQTGQKIDRPIQRSTAAIVGPQRDLPEKLAATAGSMATTMAEIITLRRLPFLKSVPGAGLAANAARGGATMAAVSASQPHENLKERAIATGVSGVLGAATEVIPAAVVKGVVRKAVASRAAPVAADAAKAVQGLSSAATPEEQVAAQKFAADVLERTRPVYQAAQEALPGAQRAAAIAGHVGGAAAFGPISTYSEYWLNKAAGNDVELPDWRDVAINTTAMLAVGFGGEAAHAWRGGLPSERGVARRGAAPRGGATPPSETTQGMPKPMGREFFRDQENGQGWKPRPSQPNPSESNAIPWDFPKKGTAQATARPGWSEAGPAVLGMRNGLVRSIGTTPNAMFGGRTPQQSFNFYFSRNVQSAATAAGVAPEHLAKDDLERAAARAYRQTHGEHLVFQTMTLPPVPPSDPKAGHRLEWRKKATDYANTLLGGKTVTIGMPNPAKPSETVQGRATVIRVEMDPTLKVDAVRVLVQDDTGRLVPLSFNTAQDLGQSLRVMPDAAGPVGAEAARLQTSRLVPTGRPELTAEGSALAEAALSGRSVPAESPPGLLPEKSTTTLTAEETVRTGEDLATRARDLSEAFRLPGKHPQSRKDTNALLREMENHGVKITRAEIGEMRAKAREGSTQIPEHGREQWIASRFSTMLRRRISNGFEGRARAIGRTERVRAAEATAPGSATPGRVIELGAGSPPPAAGVLPTPSKPTTPAPEGGQPEATVPTTAEPSAPEPPSAAPETPAPVPPAPPEPAAPEVAPEPSAPPSPTPSPVGGNSPAAPDVAGVLRRATESFRQSMSAEQVSAAIAEHESLRSKSEDIARKHEEVSRLKRRYRYGSKNWSEAGAKLRLLEADLHQLRGPESKARQAADEARSIRAFMDEKASPMSRVRAALDLRLVSEKEATDAAKGAAREKLEAGGAPPDMIEALVGESWRDVYAERINSVYDNPEEFAKEYVRNHYRIAADNELRSANQPSIPISLPKSGTIEEIVKAGESALSEVRARIAGRKEAAVREKEAAEAAAAAAERVERGQVGVRPVEAFPAYTPKNEPTRPLLGYWSPDGKVWTDGHMMVFREGLLKPTMAKDFAPDWPKETDLQYPNYQQVIPTDATLRVHPIGVLAPHGNGANISNTLVVASEDGSRVGGIEVTYYNMLRKYLGNDLEFYISPRPSKTTKGDSNTPILSALVIHKGGKVVGLIMPLRLDRYDTDLDAMRSQIAERPEAPKGATPSFYQLDQSLIPSFSTGGHLTAQHGNALGRLVEANPGLMPEPVQRDLLGVAVQFSLTPAELGWMTKQWLEDIGATNSAAWAKEQVQSGVQAAMPREWARAVGELALHEDQVLAQANAVLKPIIESLKTDKSTKKDLSKSLSATIKGGLEGRKPNPEKIPDAQRAIVADVFDKLGKVGKAASEARAEYLAEIAKGNDPTVADRIGEIARKVNEVLGTWARQTPMGGGFGAIDPVLGWFVNRSREFVRDAVNLAARRAGKDARTEFTRDEGGRVLQKVVLPIDPASESRLHRLGAVSSGAVMGDFIVAPPEVRGPLMKSRANMDSGATEFDASLWAAVGPEFIQNVRQHYPESVLAMEALETLDEPEKMIPATEDEPAKVNPDWEDWEKRQTPAVKAFKSRWEKPLRATRAHLDALLVIVNEARSKAGLPPIKYRKNYATHILNGTAEYNIDALAEFFHDRKLGVEEKREVNKRFGNVRAGDQNYARDFWTAMLTYNNWAASHSAKVELLAAGKAWLSSEAARADIERAHAVKEMVQRWCFPEDGRFSHAMNNHARIMLFSQISGGVEPITAEDVASYTGMDEKAIDDLKIGDKKIERFAYVHEGATPYFTNPDAWIQIGEKTPFGAQVWGGTEGHARGAGMTKLSPVLEAALEHKLRLKIQLKKALGGKVTPEDVLASYIEQRQKIAKLAVKPGHAIASFFGRRLAMSMVGLSSATTAINMTGIVTHVYTYYGLRHMLGGMRRYGPIAKRQMIRGAAEYLRHHGLLPVDVYSRMMRSAKYTAEELVMEAGAFNQGFAQSMDEYLSRLEAGKHEIDVQIARVAVNWMMGAESIIRGISVQVALNKAFANGHTLAMAGKAVEATLENRNAMMRALRGDFDDPISAMNSVALDEYFTNFNYDRTGQSSGMSDPWYKTFLGMFSTFPYSTFVHREAGSLQALARTGMAAGRSLVGRTGSPPTMRGSKSTWKYNAPPHGSHEPYGGPRPGGFEDWLRKGGATYWDREWTKRFIRQTYVTGALAVGSAILAKNLLMGYAPFYALAIMALLRKLYPDSEALKDTFERASTGTVFRAQRGLMAGGPVITTAAKKLQGEDWGQIMRGGGDFLEEMGVRQVLGMLYRPLKGTLELNPEWFDNDKTRWMYDVMGVKSAYYDMPTQLKAQHVLAVPDVDPSVLSEYRRPIRESESGGGSGRGRSRGGSGRGR